MKKRLLSILLTGVMILSLLPVTAFATEPHNHGTGGEFTTAISNADDLQSLFTNGGSGYLAADITSSSTLTVTAGKTVSLCLNGHVIHAIASESNKFSVIKIENGATLNLYDCDTTTEHAGYVDASGLWNLGEKSQLGAGETAKTIKGGIITGGNATSEQKKDGGGVLVDTNGTFNMFGGTITGNKAKNCGGGVYVHGTFHMQDGVIEYNRAEPVNTDAYFGGGGVAIHENGQGTLSGGAIQNNSSTVRGGGVLILQTDNSNSQTVTMSGVSISNNTAASGGGGVYFDNSHVTVTLGGDTKIKDNKSGEAENNFHFGRGKLITLGTGSDAPTSGMSVGITTASSPEENVPITISAIGSGQYAKYFKSDNDSYSVLCDHNAIKLCVEGNVVVKNNDTKVAYSDLQTAIDTVASGETIVILKDVTYSALIAINNGQTFTIDFNDGYTTHAFTWDVTSGSVINQDIFTIGENSNVTVNNMNFLTGGSDEQGNRIFKVNTTGKLTLSNMECNSGDSTRNTPVMNNGGTVIIDGGNITTKNTSTASINPNGLNPVVQNLGGTTTFKGNGTYTTQLNTGAVWIGRVITLPENSTDTDRDSECGTVIIENGTFNGGHILDVNGKANITINDAATGTQNGPAIKAFHGGIKSNITINNITSSTDVFTQVIEELETKIDFKNGNVKYSPNLFCIGSSGGKMYSVSIKNGKFGPKTGSTDIKSELQNLLASGAVISALSNDPDGYTYKVVEATPPAPVYSGGSSSSTFTVPVTGDETTVKVSATLSGSTASVNKIKDADLEKVTDGESVTIDLSGVGKNVDTAKIPTETVEKIAEKSAMTVKLPVATVEFDKAATEEIADQAKGSNIELVVDDIKEVSLNAVQKESVGKLDTAIIIDAHLASNGSRLCTEEVGGFGGGKAKVILPYEIKNNRKPENYSVFYVNEAGRLERLAAKYDEVLKAFVFEIEHFSVYTVAFDEFVDIDPNEYYYEAVKWAAANDITNGINATHFNPSGITDRAQMVTFLWKLAGRPEPTITETPFTDINPDWYYYKAVLWAYENGITDGTSKTTFKPFKNISRAEAVTFLWKYAGKPVVNYFIQMTDVPSEMYYTEAVRWALAGKITNGTTTKTFSPDDDCLRRQIVTFLYRNFAK